MTGSTPVRRARFAMVAFVLAAVLAVGVGVASAKNNATVYNDIPSPLPGNVPSLGFEATSTSEFGGQIGLAGASGTNSKVTVGMSSWACKSGAWWASSGPERCVTSEDATFSWPITLHVYEVGSGGSVGAQVAQVTQAFKMPYRPTASAKCTGEGKDGGWGKQCFHGKLFKITFGLKGVSVPNPAIVSVSYNTSDYGAEPQRPQRCNSESQGCPYDSLNVALTGTLSVGTQPQPNDAYLNSTWSGAYCNGAEGTGTFRLDAGCWTGYQPLISVSSKQSDDD